MNPAGFRWRSYRLFSTFSDNTESLEGHTVDAAYKDLWVVTSQSTEAALWSRKREGQEGSLASISPGSLFST